MVLIALILDRDVPLGIGGINSCHEHAARADLVLGDRFRPSVAPEAADQHRLHLTLWSVSLGIVRFEQPAERARTVAAAPSQTVQRCPDGAARDEAAMLCRVERHLDDGLVTHRAEVEECSLGRGDRDAFDVGDIDAVDPLRLVSNESVLLGATPSRACDLDDGPSTSGETPQRCGRTMRRCSPEPAGPARCEKGAFPRQGRTGGDVAVLVHAMPQAERNASTDLTIREPAQPGVGAAEDGVVISCEGEEPLVGGTFHAGIPARRYDSFGGSLVLAPSAYLTSM